MGAAQSAAIDGLAEQVNLTREELHRLLIRFQKLDKNHSGGIDTSEFMQIANVANNPLAQRVISIFDEDDGGEVEFEEFVKALSIFSSRSPREEKLRFAFKVYDLDRDGYISNGELFTVLKMMVGDNLKDVQLQQIVDKTIIQGDKDNDGRISFEEFCAMIEETDISKQLTLTHL